VIISDAHDSSVLELKISAHRNVVSDDNVGKMKERIGVILEGDNRVITRNLTRKGASEDSGPSVQFTIDTSPPIQSGEGIESATEGVEQSNFPQPSVRPTSNTATAPDHLLAEAVNRATDAVDQMNNAPSALGRGEDTVNNINTAVGQIATLAAPFEPLLEKLQLFTDAMNKIAEVHPYAKMAWSVVAAIPKTLLAQIHRDENIRGLVETMVNVYQFVLDGDSLKYARATDQSSSQKKIIEIFAAMAAQTIECAYFIRAYAEKKSLWTRSVKHLISDADNQIQKYKTKFNDLQAAFDSRAILDVEISVLRILDNVEHLSELISSALPGLFLMHVSFRSPTG